MKLKKNLLDSSIIADSFDLVVMGGYYGKGQRKGIFGSYLLGTYNSQT